MASAGTTEEEAQLERELAALSLKLDRANAVTSGNFGAPARGQSGDADGNPGLAMASSAKGKGKGKRKGEGKAKAKAKPERSLQAKAPQGGGVAPGTSSGAGSITTGGSVVNGSPPRGRSTASPRSNPILEKSKSSLLERFAMDDSCALAAVAAMADRGELRSPSPDSKKRNWVPAPGKSSKYGAPRADGACSADAGWQRWLRCGADDDEVEDRKVESADWWEKRKTVQEHDRLSTFLTHGARVAKTVSMPVHDIEEDEESYDGKVIEAELAVFVANMQLPCVRIRGLEDFDVDADSVAFADNVAGLKSRALRSLSAVLARVKPHSADEAFRPLPQLRPAGPARAA